MGFLWAKTIPPKLPSIDEPIVSLVLHESDVAKRKVNCRFVITNSASKKCIISDVVPTCSIPIPKVNLVAIGHWPSGEVNKGDLKLPIAIPIDEPLHVFIYSENSTKKYAKSEYPDLIDLQILLKDVRKPISIKLFKQSDGHQYKLEPI
jgi:hypothetical protein